MPLKFNAHLGSTGLMTFSISIDVRECCFETAAPALGRLQDILQQEHGALGVQNVELSGLRVSLLRERLEIPRGLIRPGYAPKRFKHFGHRRSRCVCAGHHYLKRPQRSLPCITAIWPAKKSHHF